MFRRKDPPLPPADLSVLEADVHSHLIPGLDDGARTLDDTLELARAFAGWGYRKLITTPHVKSDVFRNTTEGIRRGAEAVRQAIRQEGIPLEIEVAAEYYLDHEFVSRLESRDLLTFGGDYVLFELPFVCEPPVLSKVVSRLQTAGYRPVLAHPERYRFWHASFERYRELHEIEVILQLNINSLTDQYSKEVRRIAEQMIDEGLVGLVGSDCHNVWHLGVMDKARRSRHLHRLLSSGDLLNPRL